MSGTYPDIKVKPNNISIVSLTPTLESISHSLKSVVRSKGVQRWSISQSYPPMDRDVLMSLFAFTIQQRGRYETFDYTPPDDNSGVNIGSTRGTATSVTVSGESQTGRDVNINTISGTLKTGDFCKFANHNKVYMIMSDVDNGAVSMTIEPALHSSPVGDSSITIIDVPFTCRFITDITKMSISNMVQFGFEVSMVEAL